MCFAFARLRLVVHKASGEPQAPVLDAFYVLQEVAQASKWYATAANAPRTARYEAHDVYRPHYTAVHSLKDLSSISQTLIKLFLIKLFHFQIIGRCCDINHLFESWKYGTCPCRTRSATPYCTYYTTIGYQINWAITQLLLQCYSFASNMQRNFSISRRAHLRSTFGYVTSLTDFNLKLIVFPNPNFG